MRKKLNGFNYEQKTVPIVGQKTQLKKTVNTQMANSAGTAISVNVRLPVRTKSINTNESLCGLENG
ncbi:MAG: hypothetical protein GWO07_11380 [Candidatus Dadabacteria bacterium]|nr:hypothetical protein [Candidatus Dadabacteria bacterium]NIS09341.1 hypothetical protein [Candidatus Dadabacteria bacterium]NIY22584.1 hypothetical protein [Candidatus Dadabacteria bacterium]